MLSATAWVPRGVAARVPIRAGVLPENGANDGNGDASDARAAEARLRLALKRQEAAMDEDDDEDDEDDHNNGSPGTSNARKKPAPERRRTGTSGGGSLEEQLADLDMEHYDDDDDGDGDEEEEEEEDFGVDGVRSARGARWLERMVSQGVGGEFLGSGGDHAMGGAAGANGSDAKGGDDDDDSDDDEDEKDALEVRKDDLLVLGLRSEDDVHTLEVWMYEPEEPGAGGGEGNLYVHHDLLLPEFPLSLAWMGCSRCSDRGNFVAVGSFDPAIEVWNLDELDPVEPVGILGMPGYQQKRATDAAATAAGPGKKKGKGKKSKKDKKIAAVDPTRTHTAAVMTLAWNHEYRNVLASGSADASVLIWDVVEQKPSVRLDDHDDKVQTSAWNLTEAHSLLTAAFDRRVVLRDVRAPNAEGSRCVWSIDADAESCAWDPFAPTRAYVSAENGKVFALDTRKTDSFVFEFQAHRKEVTSLSCSVGARGLLATGSTDTKVKLWDVSEAREGADQIASQDMKVGAIFSAEFSRDEPFCISAGGAKGGVVVWDARASNAVCERYNLRFGD